MITLKFQEQFQGDLHAVGDELLHLIAQLNSLLRLNADGEVTLNPIGATGSTGANVGLQAVTGTWLPSLGGSTATSGQAYTARNGLYMKLSTLVLVSFRSWLSAKGTVTGDAELQGLPFPVGNHTAGHGGGVSIPYWANFSTGFFTLGGIAKENSTTMSLYMADSVALPGTGTSEVLPASYIADTALIQGFGWYLAAS